PAYGLDAPGSAPGVDRRHDLRRHQLELVHPRARRHAHEQRAVRRHALRDGDAGDLRAHEPRPVRDYLRLRQPLREPRFGEVAVQRLTDRRRPAAAPPAPPAPRAPRAPPPPHFALRHTPPTKGATGIPWRSATLPRDPWTTH